MSNGELTLEAKELIKKYMIKLVTIPGVLLAILGFLIGFFLNDVAKASAYNKAYEKASQLILELTKETSTAALESKKIKNDAEQVFKQLEDIKTNVELSKAVLMSKGNVKEVAEILLTHDDFKRLITDSMAGIHLFSSDKYISLWASKTGGPHIYDVSDYLPTTAKGVLIKVVVITDKSISGSFV